MALNPNLADALATAARRVPPERIAQVWLFPPRRAGARETGVAVLSAYPEGEDGRGHRTIHTVRYRAEDRKDGSTERVDEMAEQGTVPLDRVDRIIEGVLRRLDEPESPDVRDVEGDPARWRAVIGDLGGTVLDPAYRE